MTNPERLSELLLVTQDVLDGFRTVRVVTQGWVLDGDLPQKVQQRLWYEAPGRFRHEQRVGDWSDFEICDGHRRWWPFDQRETRVDDVGPEDESAKSVVARLLDPARLLPNLEIEEVEESSHHDREALLVRAARPDSLRDERDFEFRDTVRLELLVDRERGVLLRREGFGRSGGSLGAHDVVEIAFDEPMAPETFGYQPHEGVLLRDHGELERAFGSCPRTLEDAAPLMPFQIYVLAPREPLTVFGHLGDEERGIPRHLTIEYGWPHDAGHFVLFESALPANEPEAEAMRVERGKGDFFQRSLVSDERAAASVLVTVSRTQVQLHSESLSEDDLVALVSTLQPLLPRVDL